MGIKNLTEAEEKEFYRLVGKMNGKEPDKDVKVKKPENLNLDVIRNALSARKAIVETPLDKITVMAFEELIQYKETGLTPDEINGMKKRHEKIDLMATEYDNICEKYDKLYGKEQM